MILKSIAQETALQNKPLTTKSCWQSRPQLVHNQRQDVTAVETVLCSVTPVGATGDGNPPTLVFYALVLLMLAQNE
ncbi:hypothetical protein MHYP_G00014480 [Metynnis hypsauchen]